MSTDDTPRIPKIDEARPVVWTPEDASRFLTSAIHEAQKPLADALKQRPITSRALTLMVAVLVVAALAIALILSSQLEKTEKRADAMQAAREEILSEKVNLEAQTTSLQERLSAVTDQHVDLRSQIDALRQNEEKYRRTQSDLGRFRRQNELLRTQIQGLEMEKVALARQLEAVKALAEADPEEMVGMEEPDAAAESVEASAPATAVAAPEPAAIPEPAVVPEPVSVPEPVVVPEPVAVPESAIVSDPVAIPEPVVVPEPAAAVTVDSRDAFKMDPGTQTKTPDEQEQSAAFDPAAEETAEMHRALSEGRAVPGTLTPDASESETASEAGEDAGDRESFPEEGEGVASEPETAASPAAAPSAGSGAEESASSGDDVTPDAGAGVPAEQADEANAGE